MNKLICKMSVIVAALAVAAYAQTPTTPLPSEVRAANQKYELAELRARNDYNDVIRKARIQLAADLKVQLDRVTKAGKIDEAVAVRDLLRTVEAGTVPATTTHKTTQPVAVDLVRTLSGTSWVKAKTPTGEPWTVTFNDDMTVTAPHLSFKGVWCPVPSAGADVIRLGISRGNSSSGMKKITADGKQMLDESGQVEFVRK